VLTAHSLGGLFARLYARTYPDEVRGIVFVDAISATLPDVFGAKWPPYREFLQAAPGTPLDRPEAEKIDAASRRSIRRSAAPDAGRCAHQDRAGPDRPATAARGVPGGDQPAVRVSRNRPGTATAEHPADRRHRQ
jgi:pimeloyl-ACP methyl ester carboxylesterase